MTRRDIIQKITAVPALVAAGVTAQTEVTDLDPTKKYIVTIRPTGQLTAPQRKNLELSVSTIMKQLEELGVDATALIILDDDIEMNIYEHRAAV